LVGLPRETGRNISPPEKVEEAWGNALAVFESPGRRDLIGGGVPNHRPALQERIAALDRGDAGSRRDDGDKDVTMRPPLVTIPIQPVPRLRWPVEGLLLDACNTLYDATLWQRWLLRVLRRLGLHTTYRCFFHIWKKDYLDAVHRGDREFREAFRGFLQAAGLNRGQILEVTIACQSRRQRWEQETRLLPGVRTTLRRIAGAGAALAVFGDCEHRGEVLRRRLEMMGLDGVLTAVVSSRDIGKTKPDPSCYETALAALNLRAGQVAYVGSDADDLAGAARLGMQTIAFNAAPGVEAQVHIARFAELADLVATPVRRSAAG